MKMTSTYERIKMKALMVHQGTSIALDQKAQATLEDQKMLQKILSNAHRLHKEIPG